MSTSLTGVQLLQGVFQGSLTRLANSTSAIVGIHCIDLTSGESFGVNNQALFPQCSAIKIPILLELLRRADDAPGLLRETATISQENRTGGSGILAAFVDGASALSLEDLATLMIALSDNTATNMLIDRLSMDAINGFLDSLGLSQIRLQRKMIRPADSQQNRENIATPAAAAALMRHLAVGDLPLSSVAHKRAREILEISKHDAFRAPLPADVRVAWKPGWGPGARTAWAWVDLPRRPYVAAVMLTFLRDDAEGARLMSEASSLLFDHFTRLAGANAYGLRLQ